MLNPGYSCLIMFLVPLMINLVYANEVEDQVQRGEYIFNMGGCASCHTAREGKALAGGREMKTKFGIFYSPNITPDKLNGIGSWDDEDFIRAMRQGEAPDGRHYYPSFPYTSYTKMSRQDLLDLKRYLDHQPAVTQKNKSHDLNFPFNIRSMLYLWKFINFDNTPYQVDTAKKPDWNRGAYIVNGPGHCTECHTPRNWIGGLNGNQFLAGNSDGPEGELVPGLTMQEDNRISQWSEEDILFLLQIGMLPDGDFVGGSMGHVVENTTSKLTESDLKVIVTYLKSIDEKS